MMTREAPKRSATMPAKIPNTPQDRFCIAIAKAKVSRVQPWAWVMGCNQRPKPWRMPMESVKIAAPQTSTWVMEIFFVGNTGSAGNGMLDNIGRLYRNIGWIMRFVVHRKLVSCISIQLLFVLRSTIAPNS